MNITYFEFKHCMLSAGVAFIIIWILHFIFGPGHFPWWQAALLAALLAFSVRIIIFKFGGI